MDRHQLESEAMILEFTSTLMAHTAFVRASEWIGASVDEAHLAHRAARTVQRATGCPVPPHELIGTLHGSAQRAMVSLMIQRFGVLIRGDAWQWYLPLVRLGDEDWDRCPPPVVRAEVLADLVAWASAVRIAADDDVGASTDEVDSRIDEWFAPDGAFVFFREAAKRYRIGTFFSAVWRTAGLSVVASLEDWSRPAQDALGFTRSVRLVAPGPLDWVDPDLPRRHRPDRHREWLDPDL